MFCVRCVSPSWLAAVIPVGEPPGAGRGAGACDGRDTSEKSHFTCLDTTAQNEAINIK